jgi:8-oxo-dGTP pyrophosphatase MutT (NUDIX family)
MSELPALHVRETAKAVIADIDDLFVFVAGTRGQLNTIGGQKNPGEFDHQTLHREVREEIGLESDELIDLQEISALEGETISAGGIRHLTFCTLFWARLPYSHRELYIPPGSEITAIAGLERHESLAHPNVLGLAKQAVLATMALGL